ncbi:EamA family transporter [Actinophytocola xanthii]|uniref:EamA family transporter n=1 Tax=Actinophytocola xanthii TaxID=1912961 RepID=A0A1Q8C8V2_9PSEU|nr:EamA family transporter [Actinophytocola xanthii]OLF10780.1 EamA family transporter [Actinophytocola xanthii]
MTATGAAEPDLHVTTDSQTLVRRRGTVLIVLASCCFGTSGVLAKPVMDAGLSPQQVAGVRIGLAALVLLVVVGLTRPSLLRVRRTDLRLLAGYGLVGVAAVQLLYFAAVSRIPIGIAMLLEFTSPILVALWVRFVRRTVLPARMWIGTVLALTGLAMVAQVWQGLRLDTLGLLAGVGAALCAAAYFLLGEHGMTTLNPLGMVTWGMVVGAVAMAVIAPPWALPGDRLAAEVGLGGWRLPAWVLLVACAVVSTALAYLFSISSLAHLPANVASVLALVEPVVATSLAWLLLDQKLTLVQVAGAVVLLGGATIVQLASARVPPAETRLETGEHPGD